MSHTPAHTPPGTPVPTASENSSVTVTLILPAQLRDRAGQHGTHRVSGATVRDALAALDAQYPGLAFALCEETGRLRPFVNIFVNGENIRYLEDLDTPLSPGATLHVFPSVAGG